MATPAKLTPLIRQAILVANAAHAGQVDKGGVPIIEHVLEVGWRVRHLGEKYALVGILHDVIEDSRLFDIWGLSQTFGEEVGSAVAAISRSPGEKYFDYIARCATNPIARLVKIADLCHNLDKSRWPAMPSSYEEREIKAIMKLAEAQAQLEIKIHAHSPFKSDGKPLPGVTYGGSQIEEEYDKRKDPDRVAAEVTPIKPKTLMQMIEEAHARADKLQVLQGSYKEERIFPGSYL